MLYSAITCEILKKGKAARFKKVEKLRDSHPNNAPISWSSTVTWK